MREAIVVNGWIFNLVDNFYQCRGDVMYDDDHDETPEPSLWEAAQELRKNLIAEGYINVDVSHSEKGWVEVYILDDIKNN